jgi:hypothetical protein
MSDERVLEILDSNEELEFYHRYDRCRWYSASKGRASLGCSKQTVQMHHKSADHLAD